MKQIRIKISPSGVIEAETIGMKGKCCLQYLERIERMADAVTVDSQFTDDYYENRNLLTQHQAEEVKIHE